MLNYVTIVNLTLLITHQIDAAYWHEWEMFLLPGGIQFFNLFNLLLFLILGFCLVSMIERKSKGFYGSIIIAVTSALVLPIHASFAFVGFTQFHLPVSILVIVGTFVAAVAQMIFTFKQREEFCKT